MKGLKVFLVAHFTFFQSSTHKEEKMSRFDRGTNDCKIYVGNLPQEVRGRDLEDIFYKYGKVLDVDLHDRRENPFAFVEFEDPR